ncbi:MAG TPA: sulfotransferase [Dermatophilaceae bacterium]|nr:sulfotransferase [Dermatophilaceae bacterium]
MLALVIGTGRSGTTLVQETLTRHPETGFLSGLDDKLHRLNLRGRLNGKLYRWTPPRDPGMRAWGESRKLVEAGRFRLAPSEGYQLMDRQIFAGFSTPCRDLLATDLTPFLRDRVVDFFASRERAQDCSVFVQHLTGWPRTGFLQAAIPDLRAVNVVRDGRAVANSWLQMGWWDGWRGPDNWIFGPLPEDLQAEWEESGRSFPVLAALGWKMLMRAYADARAAMPEGQWMDVRYEDLLERPRETATAMLQFLGLEWTADFEEGYRRHEIHPGRTASYRNELTTAQVDAIEKVLAGPLQEWGYSV